MTRLFSEIGTIKVVGAKRFVFRNHLKSANVGQAMYPFYEYFGDQVEENVGNAVIAISVVQQSVSDEQVARKIGHSGVIGLTHFIHLLRKQSRGQEGSLLVGKGWANICGVRSEKSLLIVSARWPISGKYWCVDVVEAGRRSSFKWSAGYRVFVRNP